MRRTIFGVAPIIALQSMDRQGISPQTAVPGENDAAFEEAGCQGYSEGEYGCLIEPDFAFVQRRRAIRRLFRREGVECRRQFR